MSIVAMKRKALRKPVSGGPGGFSINGGHRNNGGIHRSARLQRSGYKCSANDASIVKPSSKTTRGYLDSKLGCCDNIVANEQRSVDYIEVVRNKCNVIDTGSNIGSNSCSNLECGASNANKQAIVVKNQNKTVSQSDYLSRKKGNCMVVPDVKPNRNNVCY